jgi:hypothetical protein
MHAEGAQFCRQRFGPEPQLCRALMDLVLVLQRGDRRRLARARQRIGIVVAVEVVGDILR